MPPLSTWSPPPPLWPLPPWLPSPDTPTPMPDTPTPTPDSPTPDTLDTPAFPTSEVIMAFTTGIRRAPPRSPHPDHSGREGRIISKTLLKLIIHTETPPTSPLNEPARSRLNFVGDFPSIVRVKRELPLIIIKKALKKLIKNIS